jgi:hypothetical protein
MSLKESLGTQAPSYKTVCRWVSAIKNGPEEIDDAPRSGAPTSQGTSEICTWNVYAVFYAWQLLQKSESLQEAFAISLPAAWGNEHKVLIWNIEIKPDIM